MFFFTVSNIKWMELYNVAASMNSMAFLFVGLLWKSFFVCWSDIHPRKFVKNFCLNLPPKFVEIKMINFYIQIVAYNLHYTVAKIVRKWEIYCLACYSFLSTELPTNFLRCSHEVWLKMSVCMCVWSVCLYNRGS